MALQAARTKRPATVGHVPHEALVRVDQRVKDILRRQAELRRARRAAEHLKRP